MFLGEVKLRHVQKWANTRTRHQHFETNVTSCFTCRSGIDIHNVNKPTMYGECTPCHSPKCDNESDIRPKMFKNSQRSLTRKFEFWQSNRNGLLLWRKDGKRITLTGSQLLPSKPRIYNLTYEYTWWRKYKNGNIILKKNLLAKKRKKFKQLNTEHQTKHAEKNHLKIWLYSCLVTESNKCQFDPKKPAG